MLTALNLGDMVFDPRGYVFIKSLRAIAVVGFMECADAAAAAVIARDVVVHFSAESFVAIGPVENKAGIAALKQALPDLVRVHVVSDEIVEPIAIYADHEHVEVHRELVWAKYRFTQCLVLGTMELYFVSSIGGAPSTAHSLAHVIKFGRKGFGGRALPVFLKGLGQVMLPSVNPEAKKVSALRKELARYDVFAVGHTRVFPMGRVSEIEPAATFGKVPLVVSTLAGKKAGKKAGAAVAKSRQ